MNSKKGTPEKQREHLTQEEQRKNPAGNFNDHLNRSQAGMPNTSGMSVKEIGVLIFIVVVLFVGYGVYKML